MPKPPLCQKCQISIKSRQILRYYVFWVNRNTQVHKFTPLIRYHLRFKSKVQMVLELCETHFLGWTKANKLSTHSFSGGGIKTFSSVGWPFCHTNFISTAWCKTIVTPSQLWRSYNSFAPSHWFGYWKIHLIWFITVW